MEFKYVRHNPRLYKTNIETQTDDVKSDGSIKLYIGQVHITVLCSILLDFQVCIFNIKLKIITIVSTLTLLFKLFFII